MKFRLLRICCVVIVLLVGLYIWGWFSVFRYMYHHGNCANRLVRIKNSLRVYAHENGGYFPSSLRALVDRGSVDEEMLHCPTTGRKYVYFLEGKHLSGDEIRGSQPVLAERGFPHRAGPDLPPLKNVWYFGGGRVGVVRPQLYEKLGPEHSAVMRKDESEQELSEADLQRLTEALEAYASSPKNRAQP